MKFVFYVLVSVFAIFPIYTFALTNINGIEITDEEYDDFIKIRSHEYIMTMNQEEYDKLKTLDYSDIKTVTKYVETTYNPSLGLTTEREITEEEFELAPFLNSAGASANQSARKIEMSLMGGSTWNFVTVTATWNGIPTDRSFDVIGVRGLGLSFREGSQVGRQIYIENGNYNTIRYAWNGTNIKKADNGFGISMNIVNNNINFLQAIIDCDVSPTWEHPSIFAAYEHAVKTVSLAESQNYTLGVAGLGNVFVYPLSISERYDGLSGIRIDY